MRAVLPLLLCGLALPAAAQPAATGKRKPVAVMEPGGDVPQTEKQLAVEAVLAELAREYSEQAPELAISLSSAMLTYTLGAEDLDLHSCREKRECARLVSVLNNSLFVVMLNLGSMDGSVTVVQVFIVLPTGERYMGTAPVDQGESIQRATVAAYAEAHAKYKSAQRGSVAIESQPAGARILVGGVDKGNTYAKIELEPGTHEVELRLDGYEPRHFSVDIFPGSDLARSYKLTEQSAAQPLVTYTAASPMEPAGPRGGKWVYALGGVLVAAGVYPVVQGALNIRRARQGECLEERLDSRDRAYCHREASKTALTKALLGVGIPAVTVGVTLLAASGPIRMRVSAAPDGRQAQVAVSGRF